MNIRSYHKIITGISLIAIVAITGCSTLMKSDSPKTINIKVTHSGKCEIENKIVPISKINKEIKSAGGSRDSRIAIIVPKDMDYKTVKELLNTLSKSGYMKVHLQNPRESVAYVNEDKKKK